MVVSDYRSQTAEKRGDGTDQGLAGTHLVGQVQQITHSDSTSKKTMSTTTCVLQVCGKWG